MDSASRLLHPRGLQAFAEFMAVLHVSPTALFRLRLPLFLAQLAKTASERLLAMPRLLLGKARLHALNVFLA